MKTFIFHSPNRIAAVQTVRVPSDRTQPVNVYVGGQRWDVTRADVANEIRFWKSAPGYTVTRLALTWTEVQA